MNKIVLVLFCLVVYAYSDECKTASSFGFASLDKFLKECSGKPYAGYCQTLEKRANEWEREFNECVARRDREERLFRQQKELLQMQLELQQQQNKKKIK